MPFGIPRTDVERRVRHQSIYGSNTEPPAVRRGLGPSMSTFNEVIWSWLPASPTAPDGSFQPPVPRWVMIRARGAGRRL